LEAEVRESKEHISLLRADAAEIKATLRGTATKEDLASLGTRISQDINGLTRDALKAVPGKQMVLWTIAMVIVTLLGVLTPLIHGH
jgi:hypothetical protein